MTRALIVFMLTVLSGFAQLAPEQLWMQMASIKRAAGGAPPAGCDEYTMTMLHMDGTNAQNSLTDDGVSRTWRVVGSALSDTNKEFGTASLQISGTGDAPDSTPSLIASPDSADFDFGAGDFTVDMWIFTKALSGHCIAWGQIDSGSYAPVRMDIPGTGVPTFYGSTSGGGFEFCSGYAASNALAAGTWTHVALVRNGNELLQFVNGNRSATAVDVTGKTLYNASTEWQIGGSIYGAATNYCGRFFVDEFRISKGIARWTANFTPSNAPYCE